MFEVYSILRRRCESRDGNFIRWNESHVIYESNRDLSLSTEAYKFDPTPASAPFTDQVGALRGKIDILIKSIGLSSVSRQHKRRTAGAPSL